MKGFHRVVHGTGDSVVFQYKLSHLSVVSLTHLSWKGRLIQKTL